MEDILGFIAGLLAYRIYGDADNPRHPIWRRALLSAFFGSAIAAIACLALHKPNSTIWSAVFLGLAFLIGVVALIGEYHFRSKRISLLIGMTMAAILGAALIWS